MKRLLLLVCLLALTAQAQIVTSYTRLKTQYLWSDTVRIDSAGKLYYWDSAVGDSYVPSKAWVNAQIGSSTFDSLMLETGWGLLLTWTVDTATVAADSAAIGTWGDLRWLAIAYGDTIQLARDTANAALARRDTLTAGYGVLVKSLAVGDDTVSFDSGTVRAWIEGIASGAVDDTLAFHRNDTTDEQVYVPTENRLFATGARFRTFSVLGADTSLLRSVTINPTATTNLMEMHTNVTVGGDDTLRQIVFVGDEGWLEHGRHPDHENQRVVLYWDGGEAKDTTGQSTGDSIGNPARRAYWGKAWNDVSMHGKESSYAHIAQNDSTQARLMADADNAGSEMVLLGSSAGKWSDTTYATSDGGIYTDKSITAAGGVTADTFHGDGSLLTGIAASGDSTWLYASADDSIDAGGLLKADSVAATNGVSAARFWGDGANVTNVDAVTMNGQDTTDIWQRISDSIAAHPGGSDSVTHSIYSDTADYAESWAGAVPYPADIYVDSATGSDDSAGTVGAPYLTIAKALSVLPSYLDSGVTIHIGTGTYSEPISLLRFRSQYPAGIAFVGDTVLTYGADIVTGGIASAKDSFGSDGPPKGSDDDTTNAWVGGSYLPSWWRYDLGVGVAKAASEMIVWVNGGNGTPRDFRLLASNDASSWVLLYAGFLSKATTRQTFTWDNQTAYRYYQIALDTVYTWDYPNLMEVKLYEMTQPRVRVTGTVVTADAFATTGITTSRTADTSIVAVLGRVRAMFSGMTFAATATNGLLFADGANTGMFRCYVDGTLTTGVELRRQSSLSLTGNNSIAGFSWIGLHVNVDSRVMMRDANVCLRVVGSNSAASQGIIGTFHSSFQMGAYSKRQSVAISNVLIGIYMNNMSAFQDWRPQATYAVAPDTHNVCVYNSSTPTASKGFFATDFSDVCLNWTNTLVNFTNDCYTFSNSYIELSGQEHLINCGVSVENAWDGVFK